MLTILADATPQMGTGHVMRCLALAQAAQDQGLDVRLAGRVEVPWVRERLAQEKIGFAHRARAVPKQENPQELLAFLQTLPQESPGKDNWLVFDGYHFGPDCQKAVREIGYKLLVIDDYAHLPEYSCDILLNQNIGAEELAYTGDIGQKLLGPKYALLRREFREARKEAEDRILPEQPQNILLTLGGGDFSEHLAKLALDFNLPELAGRTLRVIAGAMPEEKIRGCLKNCPAKLEILRRVDDMPALLLETDLCVTAGGSTCWELCCLGVSFLTVEMAENQEGVVVGLSSQQVASTFSCDTFCLLLGKAGYLLRTSQSLRARSLVSGMGAMLTILKLFEILGQYLRAATPEDCRNLWEQVNEPEMRSLAQNPAHVPWEEHQRWYATRLTSALPFWIIEVDNKKFAGYIRFEKNSESAVRLSVLLAREYRGQGLGSRLLSVACHLFWEAFPSIDIEALVLEDNIASQRMFNKVGFRCVSMEHINGKRFLFFSASNAQRHP